MTVFLCTMLFHVKLLLLLLLAALPRETTEETDKQADIMKPVQVFGGNVRCGAKMISRWPNRNITECYKCPLCRRSQGSTVICNNINILKSPTELQKKIRCEKCEKAKTYSPKKSHKMCLQCTKCKPNHKVLKNCTPRSNTVCGGCMDDSYEHITAFGMKTCEKCGLCCNDGKDSRIKECTKKGLPTKQACSRSDAERCKQKRPPKPAAKTTATSSINLPTAKRRSSRTITNTPSSQSIISNEQVIPTSPITQRSTEQPHAIHINNSNSIKTNSDQNKLLYILLPIVGVIFLLAFFAIPRTSEWYHNCTVRENTRRELSQMQRSGSSTGEALPLALTNGSDSRSNQVQQLQPLIDRIDRNGYIPTNIETATPVDTVGANDSDSPIQPPTDRIDHNGAVSTTKKQPETSDPPTCSCQLDAAIGSDTAISTNSESEGDKPSDDDVPVDSLIEQRKRKLEQSTTVDKWLENSNTHNGDSYETIYSTMNAVIDKDLFISILCCLGLTMLQAAMFYPEGGKADFIGSLRKIISLKPYFKMEELAEIFQKKKCNDLANLVREEDQRLAIETVVAEVEHNVD